MNSIYFVLNGESMEAKIKEDVSFPQLMQAINEGVSLCYDEEGAFHAELVDFAIEYMNLKTLTDLNLGSTTTDAWKYIRAIDGVRSVDADFIADGIRAVIEHRNQLVMASMQSYGMNELVARVDKLTAGFEQLLGNAADLLGNLSATAEKNKDLDLQGLANALSNGALSEQKIAHAVLDFQSAKEKTQAKPVTKKRATKKAVAVKE